MLFWFKVSSHKSVQNGGYETFSAKIYKQSEIPER